MTHAKPNTHIHAHNSHGRRHNIAAAQLTHQNNSNNGNNGYVNPVCPTNYIVNQNVTNYRVNQDTTNMTGAIQGGNYPSNQQPTQRIQRPVFIRPTVTHLPSNNAHANNPFEHINVTGLQEQHDNVMRYNNQPRYMPNNNEVRRNDAISYVQPSQNNRQAVAPANVGVQPRRPNILVPQSFTAYAGGLQQPAYNRASESNPNGNTNINHHNNPSGQKGYDSKSSDTSRKNVMNRSQADQDYRVRTLANSPVSHTNERDIKKPHADPHRTALEPHQEQKRNSGKSKNSPYLPADNTICGNVKKPTRPLPLQVIPSNKEVEYPPQHTKNERANGRFSDSDSSPRSESSSNNKGIKEVNGNATTRSDGSGTSGSSRVSSILTQEALQEHNQQEHNQQKHNKKLYNQEFDINDPEARSYHTSKDSVSEEDKSDYSGSCSEEKTNDNVHNRKQSTLSCSRAQTTISLANTSYFNESPRSRNDDSGNKSFRKLSRHTHGTTHLSGLTATGHHHPKQSWTPSANKQHPTETSHYSVVTVTNSNSQGSQGSENSRDQSAANRSNDYVPKALPSRKHSNPFSLDHSKQTEHVR